MRRNIPEDIHVHAHSYENLKSYKTVYVHLLGCNTLKMET
jgi:hypothetical protein